MQASNKVTEFVRAKTSIKNPSEATLILFGLKPGSAAAAGVSRAGVETVEVIQRIATNPILRRHYLETISGALAEDSARASRNINKLNVLLKKEFPEN